MSVSETSAGAPAPLGARDRTVVFALVGAGHAMSHIYILALEFTRGRILTLHHPSSHGGEYTRVICHRGQLFNPASAKGIYKRRPFKIVVPHGAYRNCTTTYGNGGAKPGSILYGCGLDQIDVAGSARVSIHLILINDSFPLAVSRGTNPDCSIDLGDGRSELFSSQGIHRIEAAIEYPSIFGARIPENQNASRPALRARRSCIYHAVNNGHGRTESMA